MPQIAFHPCKNKDGQANFHYSTANPTFRKRYLHSIYDPLKEAERFLSVLDLDSKTPCRYIVIGIGAAYVLKAWLKKQVERSCSMDLQALVFFEPSPHVFQFLKKESAWNDFRAKGLVLCSSITELRECIQGIKRMERQNSIPLAPSLASKDSRVDPYVQAATYNWKLIVLPSYRLVFPEIRERLMEHLKQHSASFDTQAKWIDSSTQKQFLRQWFWNGIKTFIPKLAKENTKENPGEGRKALHETREEKLSFLTLESLQKARNTRLDIHFVYCGAAPSLLAELQHLPKNAFLIAVDTAIAALLSHKYAIHLALSVDSGAGTLQHLRAGQYWLSDTLLDSTVPKFSFPVLGWTASLKQLAELFSQVYYYHSTLPLDQMLALGPLAGTTPWKNPTRNAIRFGALCSQALGCKQALLCRHLFLQP